MGKRPRSEDQEPHHLDASQHRRRRRRGRLHLIVRDYKLGCTVYKLDVDGFRPDKDDDDLDSRAQRLPAQHAAIRLASPDGQQCDAFGCTGSKIFAFYLGRGTMVYDSETSAVAICPPMLAPKDEFLTVGHDIYALKTTDSTLFGTFLPSMEKLGPAPRHGRGEWRWENLPPLPLKRHSIASSYTVHPNDSTFFLSLSDRGTFSFNTSSLAWTRLGDWLLPFRGRAYFVRELDAWVGLCSRNLGYISVCEIISPDAGRHTAPPACTTVKERVYNNLWKRHLSASLTYMGNAEFCLLEIVTRKGYDCYDTENDPRMLLRLATFRIERHRNGELRAVNMCTKVYEWPRWETQYRLPTTAFWISQDD